MKLLTAFLLAVACAFSQQPPQQAKPQQQLSVSVTGGTNGVVGTPLTLTLGSTVAGGTPPYKWTLAPNSFLPPGLFLKGDTISGTPTSPTGEGGPPYTVRLDVSDSSNPPRRGQISLNFTIQEGLVILTPPEPVAGFVGSLYLLPLVVQGGTPPYTWAVAKGPLPAGLSVRGESIAGTPTTAIASAPVVIAVTDSRGRRAQQTITIAINSDQGPYPPPTAPARVCADPVKAGAPQRCVTIPPAIIVSMQKWMAQNERGGLDAKGQVIYKYADWWAFFAANLHKALDQVLETYPTPEMQKARAGVAAAEDSLKKAREAAVTIK